MTFTSADVIIIIVILFLALKGIISGGIREFFSTFGVLGGIYISSHFADTFASFLKSNIFHTASHATLKFVSFIILLATIWWLISFVGKLIVSNKEIETNLLSQVLGYFIALIKYFAIISLILFVLMQSSSIKHKRFGKAISHSMLYPYMQSSGKWLLNANINTKVK